MRQKFFINLCSEFGVLQSVPERDLLIKLGEKVFLKHDVETVLDSLNVTRVKLSCVVHTLYMKHRSDECISFGNERHEHAMSFLQLLGFCALVFWLFLLNLAQPHFFDELRYVHLSVRFQFRKLILLVLVCIFLGGVILYLLTLDKLSDVVIVCLETGIATLCKGKPVVL